MWGADRKFHPEGHCLASQTLLSDAKQRSRGMEFSILTKQSCLILFLAPFDFESFILKVIFITTYDDVDPSQLTYDILNLTSSWCSNDVNITTKLGDVLFNQCKPKSRENLIFYPTLGRDNMSGEIRISIPSENLWFPYLSRKYYLDSE